MKAGLTPAEALKTATINPAQFLKLDQEYGKVSEEYQADLLLLNSDPLKDIRNTQDIYGVVYRGRFLDTAYRKHYLKKIDAAINSRVDWT